MNTEGRIKSAVTYKMIAEALFENYESIYDINLETEEYKTYYQSDFYRRLKLAKEGDSFFDDLPEGVDRIIAPEDRAYVSGMLRKSVLVAGLEKEKYYSLVYRIQNSERKTYHQLRAVFQEADDGMHILMGVRNIDELFRQKIHHENEMTFLQERESNHLKAVLASAAAYMEANISGNSVLEKAVDHQESAQTKVMEIPELSDMPVYDDMQKWIADHLVAKNRQRYLMISSREYLAGCYQKGEMRASVSFSVYAQDGSIQPCKAIFYLYKEKATDDLHAFIVIYNLTEQQKREKELKALEEMLVLSRIRNSTSQMKPHFLYNALGSIQELVLTEPQYAADLLGDFMIHMRSCMRAMASDETIRFSEELKNIRAYVNIEKMRLGDKLEVQYDIREDDFSVLPLTIQPLVENAIRHGVHKRGREGGRVIVRTRSKEKAWIIEVEDTGVGFDIDSVFREIAQGQRDSAGISNIRFRIEKVLGGTVNIRSIKGKGTLAIVRIPKDRSGKDGSEGRL